MKGVYAILAVMAISLLYGLATGFPVSYRLVYVLVAVLGGSLAWAYVGLRWTQVSVDRHVGRVQVGDVVGGRIAIRNTGPLPKVWLEVQDATELPGQTTGTVLSVAPRQAVVWEPRTPLRKRGLFNLGPVQVESSDLFGVFRLRRSFGEARPVVVYPQVVPLPAFQAIAAEQVQQDVRHQRTHTVTPSAATVREYSYGDSLKRIHWPTTARTGRLMSKEFDAGMGGRCWVVVDLARDVQTGGAIENTGEYTIAAAASISARYLEAGWPVGLAAHGDKAYFLPAERAAATLDNLLYTLTLARAEGDTPLAEVLREMRSYWTPSSLVVVITPSAGEDWMAEVEYASRRGTLMNVVHVDPMSFGGRGDVSALAVALRHRGVPAYVVRQGDPLDRALSTPFGVMRDGSRPVWRNGGRM